MLAKLFLKLLNWEYHLLYPNLKRKGKVIPDTRIQKRAVSSIAAIVSSFILFPLLFFCISLMTIRFDWQLPDNKHLVGIIGGTITALLYFVVYRYLLKIGPKFESESFKLDKSARRAMILFLIVSVLFFVLLLVLSICLLGN